MVVRNSLVKMSLALSSVLGRCETGCGASIAVSPTSLETNTLPTTNFEGCLSDAKRRYDGLYCKTPSAVRFVSVDKNVTRNVIADQFEFSLSWYRFRDAGAQSGPTARGAEETAPMTREEAEDAHKREMAKLRRFVVPNPNEEAAASRSAAGSSPAPSSPAARFLPENLVMSSESGLPNGVSAYESACLNEEQRTLNLVFDVDEILRSSLSTEYGDPRNSNYTLLIRRKVVKAGVAIARETLVNIYTVLVSNNSKATDPEYVSIGADGTDFVYVNFRNGSLTTGTVVSLVFNAPCGMAKYKREHYGYCQEVLLFSELFSGNGNMFNAYLPEYWNASYPGKDYSLASLVQKEACHLRDLIKSSVERKRVGKETIEYIRRSCACDAFKSSCCKKVCKKQKKCHSGFKKCFDEYICYVVSSIKAMVCVSNSKKCASFLRDVPADCHNRYDACTVAMACITSSVKVYASSCWVVDMFYDCFVAYNSYLNVSGKGCAKMHGLSSHDCNVLATKIEAIEELEVDFNADLIEEDVQVEIVDETDSSKAPKKQGQGFFGRYKITIIVVVVVTVVAGVAYAAVAL